MIIIIQNKRNNSSAPTFPPQIARLNDEVKSLAVSSEETQVLNREHHIEGFCGDIGSGPLGREESFVDAPVWRDVRDLYERCIGCIVDVTKRRRSFIHTRVELLTHWDGSDLFAKKKVPKTLKPTTTFLL